MRFLFSGGPADCVVVCFESSFERSTPAARRGIVYSRSLQATEARWNASESCRRADDRLFTVSTVAMTCVCVC